MAQRYQVVNRWVDTLILNVKGKLPDNLNVKLQHWQNQAKEQEEDVLTNWQFQGCPLAIKPHGSGHGWRWLLYSDDIHLAIGKGTLNQTVCRLTFRSVYLHSRTLDDALSQVYAFLVAFLGYEPVLQVSEVHQCLDLAGWVLKAADAERFVSRGTLDRQPQDELERFNPEVQQRGRRMKAFYFCKTAPHSCCIYDKTAEVKVHHKEWFYEIWKQNGWDGEMPVTRIEFRYERECLREMGIDDPYELLDQLDSLWAYSTQQWLRHTVRSADTNQSRWAVSAVWRVVQQASLFQTEAVPAVRAKKVELESEHTLAGFVGYGTSLAARMVLLEQMAQEAEQQGFVLDVAPGLPQAAVEEDGGGFLAWVFDQMQTYLNEHKRATFQQVMRQKMAWLGRPQIAAA
ncbi:MAG TPA: hypothetical protein VFU32_00575 [Ktedonobacterales bacterium]|nr:hypothetical protein [Ktedonobacterales bacterium]